jgi:hypothetical protein
LEAAAGTSAGAQAMEPEAPAELLDASVDVKTNEDLMNKILLLLDVQGVCVASAVCKLWHQLSQAPAFWHEVVIRKRRVTKDQAGHLCSAAWYMCASSHM